MDIRKIFQPSQNPENKKPFDQEQEQKQEQEPRLRIPFDPKRRWVLGEITVGTVLYLLYNLFGKNIVESIKNLSKLAGFSPVLPPEEMPPTKIIPTLTPEITPSPTPTQIPTSTLTPTPPPTPTPTPIVEEIIENAKKFENYKIETEEDLEKLEKWLKEFLEKAEKYRSYFKELIGGIPRVLGLYNKYILIGFINSKLREAGYEEVSEISGVLLGAHRTKIGPQNSPFSKPEFKVDNLPLIVPSFVELGINENNVIGIGGISIRDGELSNKVFEEEGREAVRYYVAVRVGPPREGQSNPPNFILPLSVNTSLPTETNLIFYTLGYPFWVLNPSLNAEVIEIRREEVRKEDLEEKEKTTPDDLNFSKLVVFIGGHMTYYLFPPHFEENNEVRVSENPWESLLWFLLGIAIIIEAKLKDIRDIEQRFKESIPQGFSERVQKAQEDYLRADLDRLLGLDTEVLEEYVREIYNAKSGELVRVPPEERSQMLANLRGILAHRAGVNYALTIKNPDLRKKVIDLILKTIFPFFFSNESTGLS